MSFKKIAKKLPRLVLASLLCTTALAANPARAEDKPAAQAPAVKQGYTVAVLPFSFSTKEKGFEDMGSEVQALMTAYLTANPSLILVERAEVDKAMSEVELGMSGTVDPETAAKVGHLTGAQVLITGRVFPVKDDVIMVAKIIGIETGRVYGETVTFPLGAKITKATEELSEKVGTTVADKGETMIARVENKEDIVGRLKPKLSGRKLPSVSVEIAERDIDHATIDPAAETEIKTVLQQLGFEIVDIAESNKRAEVEISGEAFSEFALRKGNLVSSKGRVEIKAIRKADGKVLLVDRQNSVAVDLAPEIAGKEAIAKASEALIEPLVEAIAAGEK